MRLVKVSGPRGKGKDIAAVAFACGISEASMHQSVQHKPGADPSPRDVVDVRVATPEAKAFIDALLHAPFFDRDDYAIEIREPRAMLDRKSTREITRPVPATVLDIDEELWQFTHVTYSFVVRVFIAALVLSYGMLHDNPLLMIGGLVFLPMMTLVLAFCFGALTRQWRLVKHGIAALAVATLLIAAAGVLVAAMTAPPIEFDNFPPLIAGVCLSFVIGIAASIGTADDAGHRQLVGLAAASQLALVPAWLGMSAVFGFTSETAERLIGFGVNVAAMSIGAFGVYLALSLGREVPHRAATRKEYEL